MKEEKNILYKDYAFYTYDEMEALIKETMEEQGITRDDAIDFLYDDYFEMPIAEIVESVEFTTTLKQFDNFVVNGTLGLWDGKHKIIPRLFDNLEKAILACLGDGDSAEIYTQDNKVFVNVIHHDGQNNFIIEKYIEGEMEGVCY